MISSWAAAAAPTELALNPSFEDPGKDGAAPRHWSQRDGVRLEWLPSGGHHGAMVRFHDDDAKKGQFLESHRVPARPGGDYTASAWLRPSGTCRPGVYVNFYDLNGRRIAHRFARTTGSDPTWQQVTTHEQAPEQAREVAIGIYAYVGDVGTFEADDASLTFTGGQDPQTTRLTVEVPGEKPAYEIGSRRELLLDDFLIDAAKGIEQVLHRPEAREVSLTCDAPWEGNTSAYYTLFQDGDLYRMYYRGSHFDEATRKGSHTEFACYAQSRDGVHWEKPALGLIEFEGSKANNIVLTEPDGVHNFAPFRDDHPDCAPEARYKALCGGKMTVNGKSKSCLYAYQSPDGLHWKKMSSEPVITDGAFDSQNIAFFDPEIGKYRAYWRYFTAGSTDENGWKPAGVRAIRTATSTDFLHWDDLANLSYGAMPDEHLYTNAVLPYERAPHLLIGFPTRFQPRHQQVEPVFMSSRDGVHFQRWRQELIPITAPEDRDGNRSNYMTRGLLSLPGSDRELSVYATEAYYTGPGSRVRRFAFRTDGFVSAQAKSTGELTTRPIVFQGTSLRVNLASRGDTRFELQEENGTPIPGFALADCEPMKLDEIDAPVRWRGGSLAKLQDRPIRLRAILKDADWYALQFAP